MKSSKSERKARQLSGTTVCVFLAAILLLLMSSSASAGKDCKGKNYDPLTCGGNDGTDGYSGERIDLNCWLTDLDDDTVKADGEPGTGTYPNLYGVYVNGEEKVSCRTGGTVQPNLSGLGLNSKLKGGPPIRKIDLALTHFEGPDGSTALSPYLPTSIFEEGASWNEMEIAYLTARPYGFYRPGNNDRAASDAQDHIQLLGPDESYSMATRIRMQPYDEHRYVISLADTLPADPNDLRTGLLCDSVTPGWPNEEIVKVSQDVTVYLWPDTNLDGLPDGYTVTTGEVPSAGGNAGVTFTLEDPPAVVSAPRTAAICSQEGPVDCSDRSVGGYCNFLGFADVQFTWHAENQ